jgi:hypothetical protein
MQNFDWFFVLQSYLYNNYKFINENHLANHQSLAVSLLYLMCKFLSINNYSKLPVIWHAHEREFAGYMKLPVT